MSLAARADALADLSELAADCATSFCRARCSGCDVKAISMTAKAAVKLGARLEWLYRESRPYDEDRDYLSDLEEYRAACRRRMDEAEKLATEARAAAEAAAEAMDAALGCQPPDRAACTAAQAQLSEACYAIEVAALVADTCSQAERMLFGALVQFAQEYEVPETFVARGGALPHEGRWITGQPA